MRLLTFLEAIKAGAHLRAACKLPIVLDSDDTHTFVTW